MRAFFYQNLLFRRIGWLAVWAMLLPIVLPLLHNPAANPVLAAWLQAAHCGRSASADNSNKTNPLKSPLVKPSCPICQTVQMANGGAVPPLAFVLPGPLGGKGETLLPINAAPHGRAVVTVAWPRAPPLRA
jgi:hypothetical protein